MTLTSQEIESIKQSGAELALEAHYTQRRSDLIAALESFSPKHPNASQLLSETAEVIVDLQKVVDELVKLKA